MNVDVKGLSIVALHTALIYVFLLVSFKLSGQRRLGQLNAVDFTVILLLGSAVETAMVNANTSLAAGLTSAGTLLLVNRLVAGFASKSETARHFCTCGSIVLVHDGEILEENLLRLGLTHDDVDEALRERGEDDISRVKFAIMESTGSVTVIPMETKVLRSTTSASVVSPVS